VLHAWRTWAPSLPDDASTSFALLHLPPDPALPEPLRGQYAVHVRFTHLGTAAEGEALLAQMRAAAELLLDAVGEMPYAAIDAVHMDPPQSLPFADRGATLASLPAEAVDALLGVAGPDAGSPLAIVELRLLGGAIARAPQVPNAVGGRDAAFSLFAIRVLAGPPAAAVPGALKGVAASSSRGPRVLWSTSRPTATRGTVPTATGSRRSWSATTRPARSRPTSLSPADRSHADGSQGRVESRSAAPADSGTRSQLYAVCREIPSAFAMAAISRPRSAPVASSSRCRARSSSICSATSRIWASSASASAPAPARDRPGPGRGNRRTSSALQRRRPWRSRSASGAGAWSRET
jgi:hypothetical protein